jgi:hypothetical protein
MKDDAYFKIEKGVPIPELDTRKGKSKYPFYEMEVGDSFLAPASKHDTLKSIRYRIKDKKFMIVKEGQNIRIWRTE